MLKLTLTRGRICEDTSLRAKVPEVKLSRRFQLGSPVIYYSFLHGNVNEAGFQLKAIIIEIIKDILFKTKVASFYIIFWPGKFALNMAHKHL